MFKFLILLLISTTSFASILPDNDLSIPVNLKNQGLNETEYNSVISKVESIYRDEIEASGNTLTIKRMWDSPIVNAGTLRSGKEWIIRLYGGYARHPLITSDGYLLVICHELGHHLGGPPKKTFDKGPGWPSVEGQSDYYATSTCLKKIFASDTEEVDIQNEAIQEQCRNAYSDEKSIRICKRILLAALSVSSVSASVRRTTMPDLLSKDESTVTQILESHPEPQCRLDTYLSGAIEKERPGCWYLSQ